MAAATSVTTTAVYFQIRRRCGRAVASTCGAPNVVDSLAIDLVGPDDHVLRHLDPQRGRGREVDRELGPGNLLDGQVARRRASQDAVDVPCACSSDRLEIDAVRIERALLDPLLAVRLNRKPCALREPDRERGMLEPEPRRQEEGAVDFSGTE